MQVSPILGGGDGGIAGPRVPLSATLLRLASNLPVTVTLRDVIPREANFLCEHHGGQQHCRA
jgi:hypothetical protein